MRLFLLAASLGFAIISASAEEAGPYAAWNGQWGRVGTGQYDPNMPPGLGQKPPLTPEYQAIFEATLANRKDGGLAYNATSGCLPAGMPRAMIVYETMEIIVTPPVTYIKLLYMNELRRIYTDGRDWPAVITPTFIGTSIGRWEKGPDGRYQTLLVETRGFKGPRTFDADGMALHADNQSVIKERISLDPADPDRLRDEITTIDHALTRPWTVTRSYKRERQPSYADFYCSQENHEVQLGPETYFIGEDKLLMPTRRNQPPPDLAAFGRSAP
jgi:hypothetical protein